LCVFNRNNRVQTIREFDLSVADRQNTCCLPEPTHMNRSLTPVACCTCLLMLGAPVAGSAQSRSDSAEFLATTHYEDAYPSSRREFRFHRPRDARMREADWMQRVEEPGEVSDITAGFVCINGTILAAPYVLKWDERQMTVNGREIPTPTYHEYERLFGQQLADELNSGSVLWVDGNQSLLLNNGNGLSEFALLFSCQASGTSVPSELVTDFLEAIRHSGEVSRFVETWGSVEVPGDVASRLQAIVHQIESIEEEARLARNASARLDSLAYPLTVFGMLMCVLAFGHLLAYPPFGFNAVLVAPDSPIAMQAAVRSLALIVVLSCLDLLWTMLASQAGQMRELNPLGSRMIGDPTTLIGFKFLATGIGVAMLFAIRRNHSAQVASWWMCMVLVLLSMRWVAFNSMFVA